MDFNSCKYNLNSAGIVLSRLILLTLLSGALAAGTVAQESRQGEPAHLLKEDSFLDIKGSATLHSWGAEAKQINADFQIPAGWFGDFGSWAENEVENLVIEIPVSELDGGKNKMNKDLRKALNYEDHPVIRFRGGSISFQAKNDNEKMLTVSVPGSLSVAGVTRQIEVGAELELTENNRIISRDSYSINMRDYGVEPPTAFFGAIKTGEKVGVAYKLVFKRTH